MGKCGNEKPVFQQTFKKISRHFLDEHDVDALKQSSAFVLGEECLLVLDLKDDILERNG